MQISQPLHQAIQTIVSENPGALVTLFDDMGFIVYASDNHESELGYSPQELIGIHWSERVHPGSHQQAYLYRVQIERAGYDYDIHVSGSRIHTKPGPSRQVKS